MISDGQPVNAAVTNSAFMSRTTDTSTVGKVTLNNTSDPNSGAQVTNAQRAINKAFEGLGCTGEADTTVNTYASTNYVTNGNDRKEAIEALDTQLFSTQTDLDAAEVTIATHTSQIDDINNNAHTFSGDKTFSDNVTIDGDFTVNGTTTQINTVNMNVEDQNILINDGGNDATSEGAGITVERTTTNAGIQFDSALDSKWKVGLIGSLYEVIVSGIAQTISGIKSFSSGIKSDTVDEVTLNAGVTVDGVLIKDGAINKSVVGLTNVTDDAQLKRADGDFNTFTEKVTPASNDVLLLEDSAASYAKKKVKISSIVGSTSPLTTKGDIYTYSTLDARLPVGSNGQYLTADSAQTTGLKWNTFVAPTVQIFTSGSGTYTTPAGVNYIKVKMVGGGGGGGGSGTGGTTTGGTGGDTTFGTSLLTATGGTGGNLSAAGNGSVGGTATINSPAIQLVKLNGTYGSGAGYDGSTANNGQIGGLGASSPFGGAGAAANYDAVGGSATANTGSGGQGGSTSTGVALMYGGTGGGSGAYIEAIIASPSASYSYAVGAAGTSGVAGTSGFAGGSGGSGIIIVEEYYQ